MNDFYTRLLNDDGSREVIPNGFNVETTVKDGKGSCVITTDYEFKGNSNIAKETVNLVQRTNRVIKLTKIQIIRTTNIKNASIAIRFLDDDDVLLYTETDKDLLSMSDSELLKKLNIVIV